MWSAHLVFKKGLFNTVVSIFPAMFSYLSAEKSVGKLLFLIKVGAFPREQEKEKGTGSQGHFQRSF